MSSRSNHTTQDRSRSRRDRRGKKLQQEPPVETHSHHYAKENISPPVNSNAPQKRSAIDAVVPVHAVKRQRQSKKQQEAPPPPKGMLDLFKLATASADPLATILAALPHLPPEEVIAWGFPKNLRSFASKKMMKNVSFAEFSPSSRSLVGVEVPELHKEHAVTAVASFRNFYAKLLCDKVLPKLQPHQTHKPQTVLESILFTLNVSLANESPQKLVMSELKSFMETGLPEALKSAPSLVLHHPGMHYVAFSLATYHLEKMMRASQARLKSGQGDRESNPAQKEHDKDDGDGTSPPVEPFLQQDREIKVSVAHSPSTKQPLLLLPPTPPNSKAFVLDLEEEESQEEKVDLLNQSLLFLRVKRETPEIVEIDDDDDETDFLNGNVNNGINNNYNTTHTNNSNKSDINNRASSPPAPSSKFRGLLSAEEEELYASSTITLPCDHDTSTAISLITPPGSPDCTLNDPTSSQSPLATRSMQRPLKYRLNSSRESPPQNNYNDRNVDLTIWMRNDGVGARSGARVGEKEFIYGNVGSGSSCSGSPSPPGTAISPPSSIKRTVYSNVDNLIDALHQQFDACPKHRLLKLCPELHPCQGETEMLKLLSQLQLQRPTHAKWAIWSNSMYHLIYLPIYHSTCSEDSVMDNLIIGHLSVGGAHILLAHWNTSTMSDSSGEMRTFDELLDYFSEASAKSLFAYMRRSFFSRLSDDMSRTEKREQLTELVQSFNLGNSEQLFGQCSSVMETLFYIRSFPDDEDLPDNETFYNHVQRYCLEEYDNIQERLFEMLCHPYYEGYMMADTIANVIPAALDHDLNLGFNLLLHQLYPISSDVDGFAYHVLKGLP